MQPIYRYRACKTRGCSNEESTASVAQNKRMCKSPSMVAFFSDEFSRRSASKTKWWRGQDSNLRTLCGQIYSLLPLTTRPPLRLQNQLSV